MNSIHPTAVIEPGAEIGEDVSIGAYSVIGPKVKLGRSCQIASHVVIAGHTSIGDETIVFQFASVGAPPQDLKFKGEDSRLEIGARNIVREYVTLQPGTLGGGMLTKIGDGNLFMACSHVGHDSILGNGNVVANSASIAGHVTIGDHVTIGGLVGIHQFVRVGNLALLGAGSMVAKDIPQFCLAQGDRAQLTGINVIGMERRGYAADVISRVRALYRTLFIAPGLFKDKLGKVQGEFGQFDECRSVIDFVKKSERGVAGARAKKSAIDDQS